MNDMGNSRIEGIFYYRRVFSFWKSLGTYLSMGFFHLIHCDVSLDYIYSRFRIAMIETMEKYNFDNLADVDMAQIMMEVDSLQARLISHLKNLDMKEENKKKIIDFLENWSNLFLYLELQKIKNSTITEKEFLRNIWKELHYRLKTLESLLDESLVDEETRKILEALSYLDMGSILIEKFDSINEIREVLISIINLIYNLSNLKNPVAKLLPISKKKRKDSVCYM